MPPELGSKFFAITGIIKDSMLLICENNGKKEIALKTFLENASLVHKNRYNGAIQVLQYISLCCAVFNKHSFRYV